MEKTCRLPCSNHARRGSDGYELSSFSKGVASCSGAAWMLRSATYNVFDPKPFETHLKNMKKEMLKPSVTMNMT